MRALNALWLALALPAYAGTARVALETPLSTLSGAPSASVSAPALASPLTPWTPVLAAASPLPSGAVPLGAPAVRTLGAPLALPAALSAPAAVAARPAAPGEAPRRITETLREHGALAAEAAATKGDAVAPALESNFLSAAALTPGGPGGVTPPAGPSAPQPGRVVRGPLSRDSLARRLLSVVALEGTPRERRELMRVFERMLKSPTARRYAEEFLAEGLTATVRFEDFEGSQLYRMDERARFSGARAVTDAPAPKTALVRFNRHYLNSDPIHLRDDAPAILAHELLGHGRWYSRAEAEGLKQPFHNSELNEGVARTLGWVVDYELDRRFEESGAWSFLHDPEGYNRRLKTLLPFYALTFSPYEMLDIESTLRARLLDARQALKDEERHLAAHRTWSPVADHFVEKHGAPAARFTLLKKELADLDAYWVSEVENAKAVIATIELVLKNLADETAAGERTSVRVMREAATRSFFERLQSEQNELTRLLTDVTRANPPAPAPPAPQRPADQYTFQDLQKMYFDDLEADQKRRTPHWN